MPRKRQAAIYCRISEDRSGTRLGVKRQEADCRQVADRKGWKVIEVFIDNDVSATNGRQRPAYEAMLVAIKNGDIDAVVVWDQDRLVRQPRELEHFVDVCDAAGLTKLATVGGDVDLGTGDGLVIARIKGALAAEEARKLSVRQRRKHQELAEKGQWSGGPRPFGYAVVKGEGLVINEDEAELIREAAAAVLAGHSLHSVCQDWDERGIKGTRGGRWTSVDLRRVLRSPRIAGLRPNGDQPGVKAAWSAILDLNTWRRVCLAVSTSRKRNPARRYLLTGLLFCGRCGGDVRLHSQARYDKRCRPDKWGKRGYICKPDKGGCAGVRIDADRIETYVVDELLDALDSAAFRRKVERRSKGPDTAKVEAELLADQAKQEELARLWADRELDARSWKAAQRRLEERITANLRQLDKLNVMAPALPINDLRSRWGELSLDQQQALLAVFIDRVIVNPAPFPKCSPEDRAAIAWRG